MHVILLPLFAASALAVCHFTGGIPGWMPAAGRVAMGVFAVLYTALESIFGVAEGMVASRSDTAAAAELIASHPAAQGIAEVGRTPGWWELS